MMKRVLSSLLLAVTINATASAQEDQEDTVRAACEALSRPNIDCTCVATRMDLFAQAAPSKAGATVLAENYRQSTGSNHSLDEAFTTLMQDPMNMVRLEQALETLGGRPENIEEFESGCVIPEAPAPEFPVEPEPAVAAYVSACEISTSDPRYCACTASRERMRAGSAVGFEAYYRSFSDYDDTNFSLADTARARAENMGLSLEDYEAARNRARGAIDANKDADTAYCSAAIWADGEPGTSAAVRAVGGFSEDVLQRVASAPAETKPTPNNAAALIEAGCAAESNSPSYCACFVDDYAKRIAPALQTEDEQLAWAIMRFGSVLPQSEYIGLMQKIAPSAHQAAMMVNMSVPDIGEACAQGVAGMEPALSGTARGRMMQVCIAENEDEALCGCLTDQMEAKLSPADFELIVDLREAEYRGIEDPLAYIAGERGLTREQAEQALAMNQSMMGGLMGMDMMACIGAVPGGVSIPGVTE